MNILFITDYLPYPPVSGDSIRVYNLIKRIAVHNKITLVVLLDTPESSEGIAHLNNICDLVITINHRWPNPFKCLPDFLKYFFEGTPIELRLLYSKLLMDTIYQLTNQSDFDVVQIEQSRMAFYFDGLNSTNQFRTILDFQNIAFDQYKRIASIEKKFKNKIRFWLFSKMMRRWEPCYAERFSRCITVSEADRQILLKANPRLSVDIVPNGIDTKKYQFLEANLDSSNLLFIGSMSYPPCVDAAVFFCKEVFPHFEQKNYDVHVWIVGTNPSSEVRRLSSDHIHVTGYVEDVIPYYRNTAVSIVPLRAGGGTRLKILEAMALGRPVISTTIGCEGLDVVDGHHLLIADDPMQFFEKIDLLLRDKSQYYRLASEARSLVEEKYDWDVISDQLMRIYSI